MRLLKSFLVLISFITLFSSTGYSFELDSLRMERRTDGVYVIHRVDAGETLFSISKRYTSDLAKIAEINKLDGYAIDLGQILEIPVTLENEEEKVTTNKTLHKVKTGETLYAISHIYGVNIYDIKKWNNLLSDNVKVGQELIVSSDKDEVSVNEETNVSLGDEIYRHTVIKGDNLFSIAKKYNISQDELRKINNIKGNVLSIGQELNVGSKNSKNKTEIIPNGKTLPDLNKSVSADSSGDSDNSNTDGVEERKIEQVEVTDAPIDSSSIRKNNFTKKVGVENQFEKIFEEGVAMEIANSPKSKKYLCLHRSLPTGTIIQVKNLINSQSIFVRVIGKLPDTGNNNNVLIRLSNVAYKRLGALDSRFPVEISYIPE